MDEKQHPIRAGGADEPAPGAAVTGGPQAKAPNVALWRPTTAALLASGTVAGCVLGAVDGGLFHLIAGGFESPQAAFLWGAGLGAVGGALVALARRALWGPDASAEAGTALGLLFGVAPGLAVLYQAVVVQRVVGALRLAGLVMAPVMAGFLMGGVLDRLTDAVIARVKRFQA